jgi:transcriptional regulator with XRE-family HTH domain
MDGKEEALRRFGREIAAFRQQKNYTLGQLAAASGIGYRELEEIEAGRLDPPFTLLLALARGLGVDPRQLLDFL